MNERPRRSPLNTTSRRPVGGASRRVEEGKQRRHKPDYWLLILASLLLTIGLITVYSISPGLSASQHVSQSYFITKQLVDVALGIGTFAIAAAIPIDTWKKITPALLALSVLGCIVVMLMPIDDVYRAHRWIEIGGFSFQIAELLKLTLILWLAGFLTARWQAGLLGDSKETLKYLVLILVGLGIVVAKLQSDLGSTGVMIAIMGAMAFVAGIPLKRVALIGGVVLLLVVTAISTSSYRRDRLTTFLHPESNCQGAGYQSCQALIAVGSGGVFGLGLGYSVQAYGYLPEASNDSIFAIMAEKFGFIGAGLIVGIYAVFISRIVRIIQHTSNQFNRLIVVGVLAWFSTQMVINIGAMLGLLPLKGITLPFVSQGGTSLVFLTAALGLVFQISRYTSFSAIEPVPDPNERQNTYPSLNGRGLGRAHNTALVSRPRT